MPGGPAVVPRPARPHQGEPAGLVTRSVAGIVDALLVGATLVASLAGLAAVRFALDPRGFEAVRAPLGVVVVVGLGGGVVYLTAAWASTGRTYGNHLMGLRVVRGSHRRVPLPVALLRALLCVGFPLGLLWSMPSATRRSVQDVLLGTAVVYDWTR